MSPHMLVALVDVARVVDRERKRHMPIGVTYVSMEAEIEAACAGIANAKG